MFAALFPLALALQPVSDTGLTRPLPPPGPIPGQCVEPARENAGKPGCFLAAELRLENPPETIHWHLFALPDEASATAAAARHQWSVVTFAHGRIWLHVLSKEERLTAINGEAVATVGPMRLQPGRLVVARFLESVFPPGMATRNHSHPGPEAFYVIDGIQCMETRDERRLIRAGESWHFPGAIEHVQAAPSGRKNMALVLSPDGEPWMALEPDWKPTGFCAGEG
jgi:quercetin dioxygenase-like cupin family protein